MVDQSELPFRLLTRRYGAELCYTPMINAGQFAKSTAYRLEALGPVLESDRPLIVQFAGHDPATLLEAARYVEDVCDAVDLNLGCPQGIARRGRYGSYLLEEEELVIDIVRTLSSQLSVPVTCKIRLFRGDLERTLRLCRGLEEAGCAMLTVHGRNRHQNKLLTGMCDWAAIAAVKAAVQIPVIANGGIAVFEDLKRCLETTGADGVMSSEAILENPALFSNNRDALEQLVDQNRLAREYLDLAQEHLPIKSDGSCPKCVKAHMFKILFWGLQSHHDLRERASSAHALEDYRAVLQELELRGWDQPCFGRGELFRREISWYHRHRQNEGSETTSLKIALGTADLPDGLRAEEEDEECPWSAMIFGDSAAEDC